MLRSHRSIAVVISLALCPAALTAQAGTKYQQAPTVQCYSLGPLTLRSLVDSAALGGPEVEMAELTFPPGWDASGEGHQHGHIEVLYVLSGRLGHVVNDTLHELGPGGVGIVRPGDRVRHRVLSAEPVRVLAVWGPAGELTQIRSAAQPTRCPETE